MIVITGAAGFIGSNIVRSIEDTNSLLMVDFEEGYINPYDFLDRLQNIEFAKTIDVIFHQGACTDTMCYDTKYMMEVNLEYSIELLKLCLKHGIRLIYASSAAVYGNTNSPSIESDSLEPRNVYAASKSLFDKYVEQYLICNPPTQVVGLRYFNVYGPGEEKKGNMASVLHQFREQALKDQKINLFENSELYKRDFIYVDDVVSVNLHFLANANISGIFNCGTGNTCSFLDITRSLKEVVDFEINYIKMPEHLREKYQYYTCADLNKLKRIGKYDKNFLGPKKGIARYRCFWDGK